MVGKPEPAAHRGDDDARPLRLRLFQQHPGEQLPVSGIEVADGLVEQDEIERLAHAANEGHALLLSEGELFDRDIPFIGDTRSLEHSPDLLLRLEMRELVFQADILRDGQFAEKTQILEKQDLDADYDLLTGASFSMKNMIGLKDDVSAQRKDSNHKKQRYYGYTEDYGYGITGWLQVVVEDGKIVKATSNNTDYMNEILDIDKGARYIGEFAFGVNPEINHPIGDILFDEKIAGSFHLTPGNSYDNASNGNHSAVHWDLIQIQTPEYGGGEIWFDDVLIRKDGLFVLDELKCLNPENLL